MNHAAGFLLRQSPWFPPQASTNSGQVDWLYGLIFWISAFFFLLILVLLGLFIWRYRERAGREAEKTPHHNLTLEILWTAIPLLLVIIIFHYGFTGFMAERVAPQNSYEIQVTGQKWKWLFTYPNGYVDADLHVPVDHPVRLVMTSEDVIHSLYIPAFRMKRDAVPGRYSELWFQATQVGTFPVYCAEYCGTGHSDMHAQVVVHPPGEFEKWLSDAADFTDKMSPEDAGKRLYETMGCATCHAVDGTIRVGPSFKGIFGHPVALRGGTQVMVDENYVRESILDPAAKVVLGFEPVMPTFQGRLKDKQITALIAYIKSLK